MKKFLYIKLHRLIKPSQQSCLLTAMAKQKSFSVTNGVWCTDCNSYHYSGVARSTAEAVKKFQQLSCKQAQQVFNKIYH